MIKEENKELAQWAMDYAIKHGCRQSRVAIYNGTSSTFEVRDMHIDKLQQASENLLVIDFFTDGRYGSFSTNKLDKKELEQYIPENIEATRFLAEDRARELPNAGRCYKGGKPDLKLLDPDFDKVTPEEKKELALQTCAEMAGRDKRIISVSATYEDEKDSKYIINSNGFEGETSSSDFVIYATASVKGESDARPESYWFDSSLYYSDLQKRGIGIKALERALGKIGQKKAKSGKYEMIVDSLNASRILSPVIDALSGIMLQQKNSFLLGKMGQQVMGSLFTVRDEPHIIKASGARYFDNEGVATMPRTIFDKGVLNSYFINTYSANKMGIAPTVASSSILTMDLGDKGVEEMACGIGNGILVTGFNGGNCNSATGDFSYGIEGFLIENGEMSYPVSEMNITGNMIELWNRLVETGNDPRTTSAYRIPSLHFCDVNFNGN